MNTGHFGAGLAACGLSRPDMIRIIQISEDSFITADGGLEFSSHGSNVLRFYRGKHCEVASVPLGSRQQAESEARRLAKWLATGNGDSIFSLSKEGTTAETSPVAVADASPCMDRHGFVVGYVNSAIRRFFPYKKLNPGEGVCDFCNVGLAVHAWGSKADGGCAACDSNVCAGIGIERVTHSIKDRIRSGAISLKELDRICAEDQASNVQSVEAAA